MIFDGEFQLPGKLDDIILLLLDVQRFPLCIPNVVSFKSESRDKVSITFKVDVSGVGIEYLSRMTTKLDVTIRREGDNTIIYEGKGRIAGASYSIVISLTLKGANDGTNIYWRAEVELGKTLSLLGSFIDTNKMVEQIAMDTINKLRECIEKTNPKSSS